MSSFNTTCKQGSLFEYYWSQFVWGRRWEIEYKIMYLEGSSEQHHLSEIVNKNQCNVLELRCTQTESLVSLCR